MGADIEFYIKNDPQFREFYQSQGLSRGQQVPRAQMQVLLDQYLTERPVDDVAAATEVFEGLPETSMPQPTPPPTAGVPPADFSGLVPERQGPLQEIEDSPLPPVEKQTQGFAADEQLFRNVLRVRGLELKSTEPLTKNDPELKRRSQYLMDSYMDDAPALQSFGIQDMTTYDTVARAPAEFQDKAWQMVRQQIERGEEPSWMSALESVKQQAAKAGTAAAGTTPEEDTGLTAKGVQDLATTLGDVSPVVSQAKAKLENQERSRFRQQALMTPNAVKEASNVLVGLTQEEAPDDVKLQANLDTVTGAYDYWRGYQDQRAGVARSILGDRAGDLTDQAQLEARMTDDQARRFKAEISKRGVPTVNPEVVPIVTSGPNALKGDEIFSRVTQAYRMGVPVLEYGISEDGKPSAQSIILDKNTVTAYAKRYSGNNEPPPEQVDRRTRLEEMAKGDDLLTSIQAEQELAKMSDTESIGQKVMGAVGAVADMFKTDPESAKYQAEYEALANATFDPPFRQSGYTWRSPLPSKDNRKLGVSDANFQKAVTVLEDLKRKMKDRNTALQGQNRK